jgi:CRP-like cAMP-binding protein
VPANEVKRLTVSLIHLEWLGRVLGLYTLSDRPTLDELVVGLPSMVFLQYPAGSNVVTEGDRGEELYMLFRGEAVVSREGKKIADLVPGDIFGEVGFLVGVPRTATVAAGRDCEVFRIHAGDLEEFLGKHPGLLEALRSTAKRRMNRLSA